MRHLLEILHSQTGGGPEDDAASSFRCFGDKDADGMQHKFRIA
jgi:hypothetical protein